LTEREAAAGKAAQDDSATKSGGGTARPELDADAEAAVDDEIESARAEAAENWNKYLRAVAEIDNLRKRHARDVENARRFGVERLAAGLLPVRDSLEAALKAAGDGGSVDVATLLEGDRATLALLDQALDGAGIVEIDPEGEPFDPEQHEAISMLPSDTVEPNRVLTVIQKGYELAGRIVRPARVVVARAPDEAG
jgi:molecular chaperone GrpE